ncbi:hypothetical protein RM780_09705 [Streptomyces sp. DSM 44917]|uniref:RanBP2-type domain-containing protein n=1 Tax=Streptomyces boetiae TaxID=3075541 RepID=A0ABU2L7D5_9ACTN|nr:hypothetical protein [Streptomyces sp. DSM 44917]MDT0307237.1 hypothetical protein [Streptomyces sp. DSM 44917]
MTVHKKPPAGDRESVRLSYGPEEKRKEDRDRAVHAEGVGQRGVTGIRPPDRTFPGEKECEQANRTAVFHPMVEDEGVPCIEVGGVLVFTCLDHLSGAFLVHIDLDTADDRLVRPDATVPLRIEVQGDTVLDDSAEGTPRRGVLRELLEAADDGQQDAIRDAALAAGLLWRCPACQWDNPREAAHCQAGDPCRAPRPAQTR